MKPSTSLISFILFKTFVALIWGGRGKFIIIPSTSVSLFNLSIKFKRYASDISLLKKYFWTPIPKSWYDFICEFKYTCEAGSSPTKIEATVGLTLYILFMSSISAFILALISLANSFPSINIVFHLFLKIFHWLSPHLTFAFCFLA